MKELSQNCNHLQFIMHGRGVGVNRIFIALQWGLGVLCVVNLVMDGSLGSIKDTEFLEQV
jgi:hypothetical protein